MTSAPPLPAQAPIDRPEPRPAERGGGGRLRALDGLRILAALMVCLYHYAGKNGPVAEAWGQSPALKFPTLSSFATYGSLGVQLFFIISGFVICMSSWGRGPGTSSAPASPVCTPPTGPRSSSSPLPRCCCRWWSGRCR